MSPMPTSAAVVMIVQERTGSPPSFGFHCSHKPAKDITPLLPSVMQNGCLSGLRHSYQPSLRTRQRFFAFHASRNAGFVATVSARALIDEKPTLRSLAYHGTKPQRISSSERSPFAAVITATLSVGAMLYRCR